jgi:hypothetical protein
MVAGNFGHSPSDDFKFSLGLYRMIPAKASDDFQTINDLINLLNDFFTINPRRSRIITRLGNFTISRIHFTIS